MTATMLQVIYHDTWEFLENAAYIKPRIEVWIQIRYNIIHLPQTLMTVTVVHYDPFLRENF